MTRLLLIALLMFSPVSWAQTGTADGPESQVAAQAKYWESRGRYDLARDSWLKLLRGDPTNADALAGLAFAEARSNSPASAQVYLDRLRETHPDHPQIRRIEATIRQGTFTPEQLAIPRGLAQQGQFENAVEEYRNLFGDGIPGGRLGLEFFQTLSGVDGKWDEARLGLESLAEEYPDEPVYQLALAQHYTYKEETRRRGISKLAELADEAPVSDAVQQGWRQALIWLNAKAGDERYYRSFLQRYGRDTDVSARLQEVQQLAGGGGAVSSDRGPVDPRIAITRRAYEVLNTGDVETAAVLFRELVENYPEDAEGLAGLGIVRLRQQRFEEAEDLLARASARAPKNAGKWREALASARFWGIVRRGEAARARGEPEEAERLLRSALSVEPAGKKELSVRITLADIQVELEKIKAAETLYREILRMEPENINAIRGLFGILATQDRIEAAIALAEALPEDLRLQINGLSPLKARYYRERAADASASQNFERAENLLKQALIMDPNSPWIRMDLARIYQKSGRNREANTLVDGILASNPKMPDALYIKALLVAEDERWLEGLNLLEQIPLDARNEGAVALQRRLWVRYQTERAAVLARFGRPNAGADILRSVEPNVGGLTELLGALATGWAEVGDEGRALRYMRQALSSTSRQSTGLRLQYAALLFKLRQDAEFEVVVEDILQRTDFTQQQSYDLANLRVAYRLRQADQVREDGDLISAYEYLRPLLQVNSSDPRLLMALARLYNDAKEFDRTLEIYQRVLSIDSRNLDAYKGAIGAALALENFEQAAAYLDDAFAIDARNARLFALAGRLARRRGEDGRALQYFRQALEIDAAEGNEEFGGSGRFAPQIELLTHEKSANDWRETYQGGLLPPRARPQLRTAPVDLPYYADDLPVSPRGAPVWEGQTDRPAAEPYYPQEQQYAPAPQTYVYPEDQPYPQGPQTYVYPQDQEYQQAPQTYVYPQGAGETYTEPQYRQPTRSERYPSANEQTQEYSPSQYDSYPAASRRESEVKATPRLQPVIYAPDAHLPTKPEEPRKAGIQFPGDFSLPDGSRDPSGGRFLRMSTDPRGTVPQEGESVVLEQVPWFESQAQGPAVVTRGRVYTEATEYPVDQGRNVDLGPPRRTYTVPYAQYPAETAGNEPAFSVEGHAQSRQVLRIPLGPIEQERRVVERPQQQMQRVRPVVVPRHFETNLGQESRFRREMHSEMNAIRKSSSSARSSRDPMLERPSFLRETAPVSNERRDLIRQISEIRAQRSARAGLGISFRNREGQQGLGQMLDIEMPLEFSFSGSEAGRFSLRANPVFLNAGSVSGSELDFFGSLILVDDDTLSFTQDASGLALGLIYEVGDLRLDVGSSPIGFPVETLVGGMEWTPRTRSLRFKLDMSRRPVTDSLLSYAGTEDPGLGLNFGGVYTTGGRLDIAYDLGDYGAYVNGAYHVLDGQNTDDNSVFEAGGGFYARGLERPGLQITYGVNATTFFYEKNRRRFSFGHGGYFSPQFYLSLGIPVEILGRQNRFSYRLNGSIGLQAFREDSSLVFPTSSLLQTALNDFATANPDENIRTSYPSNSVSGIGYNLSGEMEYLFAPHLSVGGLLAIDNAKDFNESLVLGYLRYWFTAQQTAGEPPRTMLPYFNFGDPNR